MAGRKSKVLFDSIDLEILKKLSGTYDGMGVLELSRDMNLTHQNLKKHLEKLLRVKLISTIKTTASADKEEVGKIKLNTALSKIYDDYEDEFPEYAEEIIKERDELSILTKFLKEVDNLNYPQETLKEIISELKKNKEKKKKDNHQKKKK